jgi:hypothetical protein
VVVALGFVVADAVGVVVADAVGVVVADAVGVVVAEGVAVGVVSVGALVAEPFGGVSVGFGSLHPARTKETPSIAAGSALFTPSPEQKGHAEPARTCLRQTEQGSNAMDRGDHERARKRTEE